MSERHDRSSDQVDRELDEVERGKLAAWRAAEPPEGFAGRVVGEWLAEQRGAGVGAGPKPEASGRSRRRLAVMALAASVAAIGLGLGLMTMRGERAITFGAPERAASAPGSPPALKAAPGHRFYGVSAESSPPPMPGPAQKMVTGRDRSTAHEIDEATADQLSALGYVPTSPGYAGQPVTVPRPPAADPQASRQNREGYEDWGVREQIATATDPISTFGVDVDTGSYSIVRRKILEGQPVPPAAVRVEEFLNYFRYSYAPPVDERPFAVHFEAAPSPFAPGRDLLRVALKAREVPAHARKKAHLVFLVDVSGSMDSPDKLPLAQRSLRILTDNLRPGDTVALVTYAGSTRVVLEPTGVEDRRRIYAAIDELSAGGSTAMGSGIELAYQLAIRQVRPDSISRVIVLSDGDANVGNTTHDSILATIQGHLQEGVTLSTVGFGTGNYQDTLMEQLADRGNGNYSYIDSLAQARRVFEEQIVGTLEVVAQDVKVQVEFDPRAVVSYRLIGYENRFVADRDFANDRVDSGDVGAGHAVTALYEIQRAPSASGALATVRIRAKQPGGSVSVEHTYPFTLEAWRSSFAGASADFRFAAAVMGLAEHLRRSPHAAGVRLDAIRELARSSAQSGDRDRQEFLELVDTLARRPAADAEAPPRRR